MPERRRSVGSVKTQLVQKAREAALGAIRTYNDPQTTFKSETFVVLMIISWTYLLHAYYRGEGVEYRYFKQGPKRRIFDRTKHGAYKHWELERCLNCDKSPIDKDTANNLRFLIGLRHEIEHQGTKDLDLHLSARYQACALNFNHYIAELFDTRYALDHQLTHSIQFLHFTPKPLKEKAKASSIPKRVQAYIAEYDGALTHEEYNSERYAYRMLFKKKLVNRPGQADEVVEFIDPDSDLAKQIDKEYWVKKEVERPKFRATDVVARVNEAGFPRFSVYSSHVELWKQEDAKHPAKGYGVEVQGAWYWYQNWIDKCIEFCTAEGEKYR